MTPLAAPSDLRLELEQTPAVVHPLQAVTVTAPGPGVVSVLDGQGREYVRVPATGRISFTAGGAAGVQSVRLLDGTGKVAGSAAFRLEARTGIEDGGGRMKELLRLGRKTLERPNDSGTPTGVGTLEWRGKSYAYYVPWLRDHVHTMKGFKYFDGSGAGAVDFFRETQREDGMIWDFFSRGQEPSFYETAYGPLGYARRYGDVEMVRMPVEADVEYLFVEGVYFAWKSTADDAWMGRQLDAAIRAMDYSFTDRARFSTRYGLVKRGYTIDTWDFQIDDATTHIFPRWGTLLVDPDRSKFGVMFGDNTGYAASCGYLAEMLERAGRPADAARFRQREKDVRERLDRVAWQGTHFRHWVPEDETVVRDVGVNEKEQVSLSNTYSLNRGITQEQAAAILRTYQRIQGAPAPGLARRVVRDLPAVREGVRRPLRAVAVRERRGVADLRRRAGARGVHSTASRPTALPSSPASSISRSRAESRSGSPTRGPTRRHSSRASHPSTCRSTRTWTSAGRARPAFRAGWRRCPTTISATCRPAARSWRAFRSSCRIPPRTAAAARSPSHAAAGSPSGSRCRSGRRPARSTSFTASATRAT